MLKNLSWYILAAWIIFFLVQLFIFFIYRVNLKIKYSKLKISIKLDLETIKQGFISKYQQKFTILLIKDFFLKPIWISEKIIKIPNFYLENNIYGVVSLLYFYNFYLLKSKKSLQIDMFLFSSFLISFHLSFLFAFLSYLIVSLAFLILTVFVVFLDFFLNQKIYSQSYKESKQILLTKLQKDEFKVANSYFKYKKLAFLKKYFLFYPFLLQNFINKFNAMGK
ncbi:hypothetical protein [Mesomycoplasma ovipneumoniae]|uniref:hypothetical protein n=1 Tax=Mesomycoplasma ovipneumoniae TaxID=29562 RepID=UPI0028B1C97E|nr:hypothetical protein [Mesomycoplasma ovipneumoniae]MDW2835202.1 hypothetical protein [Mesomycoplasma ovipneumoniae]MDW2862037.1 hypothetical protein [Mesomycoplasma ovipneumoniae]WNM13955.1 hypothetical protein RNL96_02435 [Mesomycoplasma ovipneumoniae]